MASLTWFVIVFLCVKIVFAIGESCDECLRSGDRWCHKKAINYNNEHCYSRNVENVCDSQDVEPIPTFFNTTGDEGPIRPRYTEMTTYIIDPSREQRTTTIKYDSSLKLGEIIYPDVVKGVKVFDKFHKENSCDGSECTLSLSIAVIPNFCTAFDFTELNVKIKFDGTNDEATVKYRVACHCECTHNMEINSKKCNYNGNYTCGVCSCNSERSGEYCEKDCNRGDKPLEEECLFEKNNKRLVCAGNGHCDCGSCVCNKNKEGSMYLKSIELCADVCSLTIACHGCLRNNTPGLCSQCDDDHYYDVTVMKYDAIEAESRDLLNRTVWVQCIETVDECTFNYRATREEDSFYVMINSTCNDILGPIGHTSAGSKVPLILGILAALLLVLAGGGLLLWRHMNAIPTLPMIDPQYENIEAEDCRGENPIYKPPTSSFKNPTYGKW